MNVRAELLARVGCALFGAHPNNQLAQALNVSRVSVGRWVNGRESIPYGIWVELAALLETRQIETMQLRHEVRRAFVGR